MKDWLAEMVLRHGMVIGPQKFLSAHWLSLYFNNFFPQTLDDKAKNWPLLKEPWYSLHDNAPTNSCVDGFRTAEGRAILELCLRDMVQSADCPVVIAWDTEKQKVCLDYIWILWMPSIQSIIHSNCINDTNKGFEDKILVCHKLIIIIIKTIKQAQLLLKFPLADIHVSFLHAKSILEISPKN